MLGFDKGAICRIAPDASGIELVASTGGFTLGIAFDAEGRLYTCDLGNKAVYRHDPATRMLGLFANWTGAMRVPNHPVVAAARSCLYVSDSHSFGTPGPGVWRFDLDSGDGGLWYDRPLNFANGPALSLDRQRLYVFVTFAGRVSRIPIRLDSSAGNAEVLVDGIERLPDGLAFDPSGNLYIA